MAARRQAGAAALTAVRHDQLDTSLLAPRVRDAVERTRTRISTDVDSAEAVLGVLSGLRVDEDVQLAGWLVPLLSAGVLGEDDAAGICGADALQLAREHSRIGASGIPADWNPGQPLRPEQSERLRKLLLSLATDVRLVLVRLAVQLTTMRALKSAGRDAQRRAALETREIYAPLANRLGIWQLKWELEDLAFRYSEPDHYRRIAGWLRGTRDDRERYIEDVRRELHRVLGAAGIEAVVSGRPKHIYSIWRKMQRKGLAFEQVMDVLAVRVIVPTVAECYAALGLVHGRWPYVPGEFDDYIANPKDNDYRSLHTAVIGPAQLPLEVQIRTREMHEHAELGVAAHWHYKEGGKRATVEQARVAWLRQLLEPTARDDGADLLGGLHAELFDDRVYALSPRGEVVDLPKGATPLDFAYHVHTDLGHRCRGAKVNGRMVPLTHVLANGDSVEIVTGKHPNPSRDWLVPALGFLASSRNRAKVRGWFRKLDEGENREQGRLMLDREFERLGVRAPPLPDILAELGLPNADALYLGLGSGETSLAQVVGAIQRRLQAHREVPRPRRAKPPGARTGGLLIDGVGDLMSTIARCCRPVPPEPIAGYVTLGRGVSIHRADCRNLLRLRDAEPQRVLAVDWGHPGAERTFPVAIKVLAYDRRGLVRDVSSVLADEKISIQGMQTVTDPRENTATIDLTVTVRDLDELSRLLARFAGLPNVLQARRVN
jgi:GTP pyrophosphokinase